MSTLPNSEQMASAAIDDALHTYPLRAAPAGLAPRVMARLRTLPAPPRFRLAWLDYALSLLAALMATLALVFWRLVTPEDLALALTRVTVLVQQTGLATPRPELSLALAAVGLAAALLLVGVGVWRSAERRY